MLIVWAAFGSWSLFRPEVGNVSGIDPFVGHVVVFFFVSLAALGLATRRWGSWSGVALGVGVLGLAAAVSEVLQPVVTERRRAQLSDLGGNALGILGAIVLTGLLIAVLGHSSRRSWVTAGLCAAGLVASAAVTAYEFDAVQYAIDCRGVGYEPVDSVAGGPIIQVIGDEVRLGNNSPVPLGNSEISADSDALRCSVLDNNSYTIVATVVPDSIESNGPTRIFTSSNGIEADQFNTHIGQDYDQLSIRIRSGQSQQWELVPDVFSPGERVTVALAVADGEAIVVIDGQRRAAFDLGSSSLGDWDEEFPILIGDEFTRNRTFEGTIEQVLVFDRALTEGDPALG